MGRLLAAALAMKSLFDLATGSNAARIPQASAKAASGMIALKQRIARRLNRTRTEAETLFAATRRGYQTNFVSEFNSESAKKDQEENPLREFFDNHRHGHGIWKWTHYFDVYHRHFGKFRNQQVNVLEIGIYSGGSLEMWRQYFGPKATICGVDISPECRAYESNQTKIFIGDQADRSFWQEVRRAMPAFDVVIDDGGHLPEQQIVTFEELFSFMRASGVYCCEDVHGGLNQFASYIHGLGHKLNETVALRGSEEDNENRVICDCTPFQAAVQSIHLYPFVAIVERNEYPV